MQLYKKFTPLVSIILPTYNRAEYIRRSINSVINQDFSDWELIIVDDGSTDKTNEIVNEIIQQAERFLYVKKRNTGVAISRNVGLQLSSGKYITFIDSDDEYKTDHIKLRVSEFNDSQIDCLHGGLEIVGDPFVTDKNNINKKIHLNECVVCGTLFGKREVFIKSGGFKDLSYSAESDFYERAKEEFSFKRVDFPTYIYNRNVQSSICNNI